MLCAVLRYESPAWIDAYLAEALAERDASKPPVQHTAATSAQAEQKGGAK